MHTDKAFQPEYSSHQAFALKPKQNMHGGSCQSCMCDKMCAGKVQKTFEDGAPKSLE